MSTTLFPEKVFNKLIYVLARIYVLRAHLMGIKTYKNMIDHRKEQCTGAAIVIDIGTN